MSDVITHNTTSNNNCSKGTGYRALRSGCVLSSSFLWQETRDGDLNDGPEMFLLTQLGFMIMLKTGRALN